jgi:NlpC/P60 family protein
MDVRLRSRGARLVAAMALTIGAARSVAAQGPGLFDMFVSRKEKPSDPLFGGIALGGYRGLVGFRVSGGLHFSNDDGQTTTTVQPTVRCDRYGCRRGPGGRTQYQEGSLFGVNVGGWTADADLLIAPLRAFPVAKSLLLGFSPYAFVGIGGTGIRPNGAPDTSRATLSYGLGAHHDLFGRLGVTAEARYRRPLASDSALTLGTRRDWEYRVGFSVSFGGGRSTAKEAPRVIVARPVETQPVPDVELAAPDVAGSGLAARVIDAADDLLAIRYRAGGTKPETGFDAAGFVQYVFGQVGVRLPDAAREMARVGREVSTRVGALRPGDLLFFANDGTNINHVAIYAGQDRIIHATASGGGVRYDTLGEGERGEWFADHLVTARRVTRSGGRDATEP